MPKTPPGGHQWKVCRKGSGLFSKIWPGAPILRSTSSFTQWVCDVLNSLGCWDPCPLSRSVCGPVCLFLLQPDSFTGEQMQTQSHWQRSGRDSKSGMETRPWEQSHGSSWVPGNQRATTLPCSAKSGRRACQGFDDATQKSPNELEGRGAGEGRMGLHPCRHG